MDIQAFLGFRSDSNRLSLGQLRRLGAILSKSRMPSQHTIPDDVAILQKSTPLKIWSFSTQ